ncbi:DUF6164 family protein [Candidatus Nitrosoglobus terrae]|nr:DUF6164 family protein [Candidatus Nitrosoglobus terrae]
MACKLFSLRDVSEDEAEEIRELLNKNEINYYETPSSIWGISTAAIYLKNEHLLEKANLLITRYQTEKAYKARKEHEKLKREGKTETIIDRIKKDPIKIISHLMLIIIILYLSIKPFISLGN